MASFTVAIMQPYFLPYAGYFRLFSASDLFVIYDCVQFPRRGWVHRNRLIDRSGAERWLTLPLAKASQSVLIRDLRFAPNATEIMAARLEPFLLSVDDRPSAVPLLEALREVRGIPVDYISRLLERVVSFLGLPWSILRSSSLAIPDSFRGQARIIEIARRVGASRYLNAPGGRDLYDMNAFADCGIELAFLPEYSGPKYSIMSRIILERRDELAYDIIRQTQDIGEP